MSKGEWFKSGLNTILHSRPVKQPRENCVLQTAQTTPNPTMRVTKRNACRTNDSDARADCICHRFSEFNSTTKSMHWPAAAAALSSDHTESQSLRHAGAASVAAICGSQPHKRSPDSGANSFICALEPHRQQTHTRKRSPAATEKLICETCTKVA